MKPFKSEPCVKCSNVWHGAAVDMSDETAASFPTGKKCIKCGHFTPSQS